MTVEVAYQRPRLIDAVRVSVLAEPLNCTVFGLPRFVVLVPVQLSPPAMKTLVSACGSNNCELQKRSLPVPLGNVRWPTLGSSEASQAS